VVQIPSKLKVHPKPRSVAKELGQSKSRCRRNSAASVDEFVHPLIGNPDSVGEIALGNLHRFEKLLKEHLTRVSRFSMGRYSDHGKPSRSMVIDDFDRIRTIIAPHETDPILLIDAYAVLSFSVSRKPFETVSWRNPQLLDQAH